MSPPHVHRPTAVPDHAHPLVRELVRLMNVHRMTWTDLAERSGIHRKTFHYWRTRSSPTLSVFEAALNSLGYGLAITQAPLPKRPAERREEARA